MIVQPYEPGFRGGCIEVFRSNIPEFFYEYELKDFLKYLDESAHENYWCIFHEKQIIGCGGIWVGDGGVGRMVWGLIHSQFHKKGFGRRLLEFRLKKFAERLDVKRVQLDTSQHNPAFFNKFGFRELSVKKNHYGPGLDSHEMELDLDEAVRIRILGSFGK